MKSPSECIAELIENGKDLKKGIIRKNVHKFKVYIR